MKKKCSIILTVILMLSICLTAVSCKKEEKAKEKEDIYTGSVLLNGFETTKDMYKVTQHTYMKDGKWTGRSATGKLQVVGKENFIPQGREYEDANVHQEADLAPRQGQGALHVNYISSIDKQGGFTQIIARFSVSDLSGLPTDKLGGVSLQIYNDNSSEREVTLTLVKNDLSLVTLSDNKVVLKPYAWTECKVDFNPAIVKYFSENIVGLSIEFDNKNDSAYYIDNLCVSFEQVLTDEMKENLKLVEELEKAIEKELSTATVTLKSKEILTALYAQYLSLPEEYQAIVKNYSLLSDGITKYLALAYDEEMSLTGQISILRFDEIFGLMQIGEHKGSTVSYTTDVHAPSEEGALCIEFDGSMDWVDMLVTPNLGEYEEMRVWMKNDSELARIFQNSWKTLAATGGVAYDESGEEITNTITEVEYNNNIVSKDGWVQLVWREGFDITSLNFASFDVEAGQLAKCQGKLYVGKVVGVSKASGLIARIDALEEKDSYSDEELIEIFDLYYAFTQLTKEQKNVLGIARAEKIERIYMAHCDKVIQSKINSLTNKDEYSAAEIKEINGVKTLYDQLPADKKKNVNTTALNRILNKISGYNKSGKYMDVTEYNSSYENKLFYSVKEKYSDNAFSLRLEDEIKDGSYIYLNLPETITNAKRLKIAIKNTSAGDIAFWPAVVATQGGAWLEPANHSVIFTQEEGWVELVYDITGLDVDTLIFTYAPTKNATLSCHIGKIEVVRDMSKEVAAEIAKLSEMVHKKEFTSYEVKWIKEIKDTYDGLSKSEQAKVDTTSLERVLSIISDHDKAGNNMDVTKYDLRYENTLLYSKKEVYEGEKFSIKMNASIADEGAVGYSLPEKITGRKMTITVKNTSDKDVAFWPSVIQEQGGEWLSPTNHSVLITNKEGWVDLTYDISGLTIDVLLAAYGPFENGNLGLYIGKIEILKDYVQEVEKELAYISDILDQEEFTATEVKQILRVKHICDNNLTEAEKRKLNLTQLNKVVSKIEHYNSSGENMDVTAYDSTYDEMLYYSVKETVDEEKFSLKLDREVGNNGAELILPEAVYNARKLILTVKNTSDNQIALWPSDSLNNGEWLTPNNHSIVVANDEGWVELVYDITDKMIDRLFVAYNPWNSGHVSLYIGKVEVIASYLPEVEKVLESVSDILDQDEFTADEISKLLQAKEDYDSKLTEAEKQQLDITELTAALERIQYYESENPNMNIMSYEGFLDGTHNEVLSYSVKEKVEDAEFSLKYEGETKGEIEGNGDVASITLPNEIVGDKLLLTIKNTSDNTMVIWPQAETGEWLTPTNHNGSFAVTNSEGWTTLEYDIREKTVIAFLVAYNPWESGQISFYIGDIQVEEIEENPLEKVVITNQAEGVAVSGTGEVNLQGQAANTWYWAQVEPITFTGKELHIFVKNDASVPVIFQLTWVSADKVLDENGTDISASVIQAAGNVLPANSGWIELIYQDADKFAQGTIGEIDFYYIDENGTGFDGGVYIKGYQRLDASMDKVVITNQADGVNVSGTEEVTLQGQAANTWYWAQVEAITFEGKEIHIFVKNDASVPVICQFGWVTANKALDENGTDISGTIIQAGGNVLPANSGWIELVYTEPGKFDNGSIGEVDLYFIDENGTASDYEVCLKGYQKK